MKRSITYFVIPLLLVVLTLGVFVGCAYALSKDNEKREETARVCDAASIFDCVTPEVVRFYEEEIAGEQIISDKSEAQLCAIAKRYGISVAKARGALIVYDFSNRTGGGVDFPQIAQMSELKILSFFKARAEVYKQSLSEEKKEELKQKAKDTLGLSL